MSASILRTSLLLVAGLVAPAASQSSFAFVAGTAGDDFGRSVVGVGDVNGDGHPDVAIAAPALASTLLSGPLPSVRVISGADASTLWVLTGDGDDQYGAGLAAVGDVDLDGVVDIGIGAPGNPGGLDRAEVRSGVDGHLIHQWTGLPAAASVDQFGSSIAGGLDADGDGVPDVLVGAPGWWDQNPFAYVKLFSGATGQLLLHVTDATAAEAFGASVCFIPDKDGDGRPDILLGVPQSYFHPHGYLRAVGGQSGATLATIDGSVDHDAYGLSLRLAGDADGNGTPDVIATSKGDVGVAILEGSSLGEVTSFDNENGLASTGTMHAALYTDDLGKVNFLVANDSGQSAGVGTGKLSYWLSWEYYEELKFFGTADEAIGTSIEVPGDLDGDGVNDVALGTRLGAAGSAYVGHVHLVSGAKQFFGQNQVVEYGLGCPGTNGAYPTLSSSTYNPVPGKELKIQIAGLGGAPAALVLGLSQGNLPLANGCHLLVGQMLPIVVPVVLPGTPPFFGHLDLASTLPWHLPVGTTIAMQVFISDPLAPGHKSATNGLSFTIP